jgi:uncharacterized protein (UPF0335 family)
MTDFSVEIGGERFETSTAEMAAATEYLGGVVRGEIKPPAEPENSSSQMLRLFIERIERLNEEKKGMADDIRDVFSESKSQGFDPKIMRQVIKLRAMESHDRQEMQAILETYKRALGLG